jgi:CheY-like chemotaxis protein
MMKILYVEDNDDNVYMLKSRLSRAGFTIMSTEPASALGRRETPALDAQELDGYAAVFFAVITYLNVSGSSESSRSPPTSA